MAENEDKKNDSVNGTNDTPKKKEHASEQPSSPKGEGAKQAPLPDGIWVVKQPLGAGAFGRVYLGERTVEGKKETGVLKMISIPRNQEEMDLVMKREGMTKEKAAQLFANIAQRFVSIMQRENSFRDCNYLTFYHSMQILRRPDGIGCDILLVSQPLLNLRGFMNGRTFREEEIIQLGIDVCKGLEYLNENGLKHGDIRPGNLFISREGRFCLGEIGTASAWEQVVGGTKLRSKNAYMAPELYKGEDYDQTADTYALGIVLYQYLNQDKIPFLDKEVGKITGEDIRQAVEKRMAKEEIPAPAKGSDRFKDIVKKACSYEKEDRYQSATEMRKALEEAGKAGFHVEVNKGLTEEEKQIEEAKAQSYAKVKGFDISNMFEDDSEETKNSNEPKKRKDRKKKEDGGWGWKIVSAIVILIALAGIVTALLKPTTPKDPSIQLDGSQSGLEIEQGEDTEDPSENNGTKPTGEVSSTAAVEVMETAVIGPLTAEGAEENGDRKFTARWSIDKEFTGDLTNLATNGNILAMENRASVTDQAEINCYVEDRTLVTEVTLGEDVPNGAYQFNINHKDEAGDVVFAGQVLFALGDKDDVVLVNASVEAEVITPILANAKGKNLGIKEDGLAFVDEQTQWTLTSQKAGNTAGGTISLGGKMVAAAEVKDGAQVTLKETKAGDESLWQFAVYHKIGAEGYQARIMTAVSGKNLCLDYDEKTKSFVLKDIASAGEYSWWNLTMKL